MEYKLPFNLLLDIFISDPPLYVYCILYFVCTVDQNIIGAPGFQYCDSNIGVFSIAPCTVFAVIAFLALIGVGEKISLLVAIAFKS